MVGSDESCRSDEAGSPADYGSALGGDTSPPPSLAYQEILAHRQMTKFDSPPPPSTIPRLGPCAKFERVWTMTGPHPSGWNSLNRIVSHCESWRRLGSLPFKVELISLRSELVVHVVSQLPVQQASKKILSNCPFVMNSSRASVPYPSSQTDKLISANFKQLLLLQDVWRSSSENARDSSHQAGDFPSGPMRPPSEPQKSEDPSAPMDLRRNLSFKPPTALPTSPFDLDPSAPQRGVKEELGAGGQAAAGGNPFSVKTQWPESPRQSCSDEQHMLMQVTNVMPSSRWTYQLWFQSARLLAKEAQQHTHRNLL